MFNLKIGGVAMFFLFIFVHTFFVHFQNLLGHWTKKETMNKNEQKWTKIQIFYTLIWYYIFLTIFVHFCSHLFCSLSKFAGTLNKKGNNEQKWTKIQIFYTLIWYYIFRTIFVHFCSHFFVHFQNSLGHWTKMNKKNMATPPPRDLVIINWY